MNKSRNFHHGGVGDFLRDGGEKLLNYTATKFSLQLDNCIAEASLPTLVLGVAESLVPSSGKDQGVKN